MGSAPTRSSVPSLGQSWPWNVTKPQSGQGRRGARSHGVTSWSWEPGRPQSGQCPRLAIDPLDPEYDGSREEGFDENGGVQPDEALGVVVGDEPGEDEPVNPGLGAGDEVVEVATSLGREAEGDVDPDPCPREPAERGAI